jgi:hypothetical protein
VFNDPKQLHLLEDIARSSRRTCENLESIRSQLGWMSVLLVPILLANAAAAVKLFLLA